MKKSSWETATRPKLTAELVYLRAALLTADISSEHDKHVEWKSGTPPETAPYWNPKGKSYYKSYTIENRQAWACEINELTCLLGDVLVDGPAEEDQEEDDEMDVE